MKYLIEGGHETYCRICGAPTNNIGNKNGVKRWVKVKKKINFKIF